MNLKLHIPNFSGGAFNQVLFEDDGIVYFTITGSTGPVSIENYVYVYENEKWEDITPKDNNQMVNAIACLTGTSTEVLLAMNSNYAYAGDKAKSEVKFLRQLATAVESRPSGNPGPNDVFYSATDYNVTIPNSQKFILSSNYDGTGNTFVDDLVTITINKGENSRETIILKHDYSKHNGHSNSGKIWPLKPDETTGPLTEKLNHFIGQTVSITTDLYKNAQGGSAFFLCYEE